MHAPPDANARHKGRGTGRVCARAASWRAGGQSDARATAQVLSLDGSSAWQEVLLVETATEEVAVKLGWELLRDADGCWLISDGDRDLRGGGVGASSEGGVSAAEPAAEAGRLLLLLVAGGGVAGAAAAGGVAGDGAAGNEAAAAAGVSDGEAAAAVDSPILPIARRASVIRGRIQSK